MSGPRQTNEGRRAPSAGDRLGLVAVLLLILGGAVAFRAIYRSPAPPPGRKVADDRLLVLEHGGAGAAHHPAPKSRSRDHQAPRRASRRGAPPRSAPRSSPATGKTHTVLRGESLYEIAQEFYGEGPRWREIAEANGLTPPFVIQPGQVLEIP